MTATLAPFGFRPATHQTGTIRTQGFPDGIASGYSSNIFSGAPVLLNTNGTLNAVSSANDILGIFAGVEYTPAGGGRRVVSPYWPANATYDAGTCYAYVYTDPSIIYDVQADGSLAISAIGDQADVTNWSNGSTYTGLSGATLSSTLKGAGVQGMFRVIDLYQGPDNAWGDSYTIVRVQIARHQFVTSKVAV